VGQRAGDGAEIVQQSGRYILIRDADGHSIYDLDMGADADPIASFPPGDSGFEAAWDRFQRSIRAARRERYALAPVLTAVAVVAAVVWMVTGTAYGLLIVGFAQSSFFESQWFQWIQAADSVAYHVMLGALTVLVALWLRKRLGADPGVSAPRPPASGDRGSDPAVP
jgi:predicted anti-sigma-YlaC factor YlaD